MRINSSIKFFLMLFVVFFSIFSCADTTDPENEVTYYETFNKWVAANYPTLTQVEDEEGIFANITKNTEGNTVMPVDSSYVAIVYSVVYPSGRCGVNMDPYVARRLGTFSYNTNYVPFIFKLEDYANYYGLTEAHYKMLLKMSEGDVVEMAVAPLLGYSMTQETMYEGFGGDVSIYADAVYIKMELVSIYPDLEATANTDVINYVAGDSDWVFVRSGLYMKTLVSNDNAADSIRSDTTLQLNYTGYFIDGFVFDTNIAEVAEENNIFNSTVVYEPLSYEYERLDTSNYGGLIEAIKMVVTKMNLGEKVTFITSPEWAYGETGSYNTTGTLIYSYSPLIFDLEVVNEN